MEGDRDARMRACGASSNATESHRVAHNNIRRARPSSQQQHHLVGVLRPEDLDLTRARILDRILSGDATEDDNTFRDLLQKRNSSILAHGLKPVSEGSAMRFLEYVDAMVDRPEIRASAKHARLREL